MDRRCGRVALIRGIGRITKTGGAGFFMSEFSHMSNLGSRKGCWKEAVN